MSELFKDGCDNYNSSQELRKWDNSSVVNIINSAGRFGGGALQVGIDLEKNVGDKATLRIKFALNRTSSDATRVVMSLLDTASTQVRLDWRADNSLEIFGGSGVSLATTPVILNINTYHHFEIVVVFHATTGSVEVRVDGVEVILETPVDTITSANAFANIVSFSLGSQDRLDDVVIYDDATFNGDHRIYTLYPDGEGNYTQFATTEPTNPTTHWDKVEETTAIDDDTSYNEDGTITNKDSFTMENLPSLPVGATIESVQHHYNARKDDAGDRSIRGFLRIGGSDHTGTENVLTTSYQGYTDNHIVDPDTATTWTTGGIDGTETGCEVR